MIFKLTKEQIEEIIELYGGSKQTINAIEKKLNLAGVIPNEEDYFEIVCAVVAQRETSNLKKERMTYDDIIKIIFKIKYDLDELDQNVDIDDDFDNQDSSEMSVIKKI